MDDSPPDEAIGRLVGHIRIVGTLGDGGSGTVYEGIDETLGRRVALKAIHADRLLGDARARLAREARVLSRLEHPRICRIHEYARGEDRDYLVLEKVEGRTLSQVLREEPARLTPRLRLRIAEQLADVLVRTHAAGVVHRDLKPSNVMLTPADEIKVLDFGIALVDERESVETRLDPDGGEGDGRPSDDSMHTLVDTRRGRILGSAHFISPEQARGERASPASDLYSFGLLLQELFTGRRPHPAGLTVEQLLARAVIGESEPPAGLPADLTRLIDRLKSPAARDRPTAAEARHALRRIADLPRRRLRVAAVAAALLLVVAAAIAHTVRLQQERNAAVAAQRRAEQAQRESERARTEEAQARAEAQQVVDFLTGLFSISDPEEAQGRTITADELLRKGAAKIDEELADQPLVRARLMTTIGTVYRELGLYDDAERILTRALALRRSSAGSPPTVAAGLRALGILRSMQGRYAEAETALGEALSILDHATPRDEPGIEVTLTDLGEVRRHRGDWKGAEAFFQRALELQKKRPEDREGLAKTLNNLAGVYWRTERLEQAESLMRQVLAIDEETLGPDHPRLARTLNNLGLLAEHRGQLDEAEALFRRALAIKEKALGPEHPELASTLYNIGETRWRQEDLGGALDWYRRALALDEKGSGPDHPNVAFTLMGIGAVYRDQRRWAEAEAAYRRALAIFDKAAPGHPARQEAIDGLAELRKLRAAAGNTQPTAPHS